MYRSLEAMVKPTNGRWFTPRSNQVTASPHDLWLAGFPRLVLALHIADSRCSASLLDLNRPRNPAFREMLPPERLDINFPGFYQRKM